MLMCKSCAIKLVPCFGCESLYPSGAMRTATNTDNKLCPVCCQCEVATCFLCNDWDHESALTVYAAVIGGEEVSVCESCVDKEDLQECQTCTNYFDRDQMSKTSPEDCNQCFPDDQDGAAVDEEEESDGDHTADNRSDEADE